jgi:hypothetical protein
MTLTVMKQVVRISRESAVAIGLLLAAALRQTAPAQADGVTPAATQLLKASTDFLSRQQRFSLDTASSIDVVLPSGQKVQFDHTAKVSVERPNKLRAERTGDMVDQVFYYDGKSLTLHNPYGKYYATIAAPGTLEEVLDFARTKLDVVAPAGDLLYKNAYDILMQDVTSGFVVGKGVVEGVRCDHLAFRAPDVDRGRCPSPGTQTGDHQPGYAQRASVHRRREALEPQAKIQRFELQLQAVPLATES